METFEYISNSVEDTIAFGECLGSLLQANDCVVLDGELGAGKTQIAKGVANSLGIFEEIVSPTFNIFMNYGGGSYDLHHFDLYRLDNPGELEDIGFYDTLEDGAVTLIEWGLKFPDEMPYSYLLIELGNLSDGKRKISCSAVGDRPRKILAGLKKLYGGGHE